MIWNGTGDEELFKDAIAIRLLLEMLTGGSRAPNSAVSSGPKVTLFLRTRVVVAATVLLGEASMERRGPAGKKEEGAGVMGATILARTGHETATAGDNEESVKEPEEACRC